MTTLRALVLAAVTAAVVTVTLIVVASVPTAWAILIGLPAGCVVLVAALLSGTFDVDWTVEPDPPADGVTLHASSLTERLEQAASDPYRFTSRVQPRLHRLAVATLRHRTAAADLADPRARELLGDDLHRLLTASDAQLPPPKTFAALLRRLEEL